MKKFLLCCLIFFLDPVPIAADSGRVIFSEIKQLPKKWWRNPHSVWAVWDKNTLYLWGANKGNYKIRSGHVSLHGSGMASSQGPSRGRGHPHYIGVITTSLSDAENDEIFAYLEEKIKNGMDIVFPVSQGRFSLGTGVAFKRHATINDWYKSQHYLFTKIIDLTSIAKEVVIMPDTFWPDCGLTMSNKSPLNISIKNVEDIKKLLHYINKRSIL